MHVPIRKANCVPRCGHCAVGKAGLELFGRGRLYSSCSLLRVHFVPVAQTLSSPDKLDREASTKEPVADAEADAEARGIIVFLNDGEGHFGASLEFAGRATLKGG